jgi:hypothetical protein
MRSMKRARFNQKRHSKSKGHEFRYGNAATRGKYVRGRPLNKLASRLNDAHSRVQESKFQIRSNSRHATNSEGSKWALGCDTNPPSTQRRLCLDILLHLLNLESKLGSLD